ncbi:MFS transporter [Phaeacidiphilus oryzae]|uniref:MFS transporter n=1 Tax=Phaeacidiphilus oryzae TaxID=348818 RepID=UPI000A06E389|nr:MFS transporter [Phaeacidiphilus oryzae]
MSVTSGTAGRPPETPVQGARDNANNANNGAALSAIVQELPWKWRVQGRIFVIGGLGYLFDAWDVTLNGYLTPLLGTDFHLGMGQRSLVATANLVGMAAGALLWGAIADRIGRKRAFSITLLVFALFSVLGAAAPDYPVFLVLRFLAGVGLGGCIPVDYALVGEFSPRKYRGRVLTAMDAWWPIGGTLCGLVCTGLVSLAGGSEGSHGVWRWLLVVMVLPALLLFWIRRGVPESPVFLARNGREAEARAVIARLVEETGAGPVTYPAPAPSEPGPREERADGAVPPPAGRPLAAGWAGLRSGLVQLGLVWRSAPRITSVAWALFVTVMLVYYAALSWMPTILADQGYAETAAFSGTTLMSGVGIVGVLTAAWLVDVVGRKPLLGLAAPVAAIALVLFAVLLHTQWAALTLLGLFGFLVQLAIPPLYAYVAELYPTRIRASGFGAASAASRVATGFAPLLFGSVLWPVLGLPLTFAVLGAAVVLAVVWMAFAAPETKGRELDAEETDMGEGVPS